VILCVCDVRSVLEHPGEPVRGHTISVWMFLSGGQSTAFSSQPPPGQEVLGGDLFPGREQCLSTP
jgi:hypothetical protein